MPINAGSIFAEKVNVGVTIKGGEGASIARGKGERERVGMKDGPCVTTGLVMAG